MADYDQYWAEIDNLQLRKIDAVAMLYRWELQHCYFIYLTNNTLSARWGRIAPPTTNHLSGT